MGFSIVSSQSQSRQLFERQPAFRESVDPISERRGEKVDSISQEKGHRCVTSGLSLVADDITGNFRCTSIVRMTLGQTEGQSGESNLADGRLILAFSPIPSFTNQHSFSLTVVDKRPQQHLDWIGHSAPGRLFATEQTCTKPRQVSLWRRNDDNRHLLPDGNGTLPCFPKTSLEAG